jgi:hypothetical protein
VIIERPVAVDVNGRRAGERDLLTRLDAYNQQVMETRPIGLALTTKSERTSSAEPPLGASGG